CALPWESQPRIRARPGPSVAPEHTARPVTCRQATPGAALVGVRAVLVRSWPPWLGRPAPWAARGAWTSSRGGLRDPGRADLRRADRTASRGEWDRAGAFRAFLGVRIHLGTPRHQRINGGEHEEE